MTKLILSITCLVSILVCSNCGTIANELSKENKDKRPLFLMNCPSDAVVTFDDQTYSIETADYIKYQVVMYTKVSMPAVQLPYTKPGKLTIKSASMGKTASIDLKAGLWAASTCGNCLILPVLGHAIDYGTKNDRILKPRVIDVRAFLNGEPKNQWQKP